MIKVANDIDLSLIGGFLDGLKPDPIMTVSEWADAKRILPPTSPEPGPYRTSRTPYAREIMDKLSVNDPATKIIVKKGSQVGFTEIGNNWVGYIVDVAPANTLYLMPTDALMKKTSKERIETMLAATPSIAEKSPKKRSKDSHNTLLHKEFPGMFLNMVGANSPVGLSSASVRNVYGDEIDRMPANVGNEGSPVDLADTRTSFYGNRRKMFLTSTPTIKGTSIIDTEFEKTGQRYYHLPCPHCNHYQPLVFEQLKYEVGKYDNVQYECASCKQLIPEHRKTWMLANGKWVPKYPEREDGYTFGYHLSAMYAPYGTYSWRKMAQDYESSRNDIPKKIVFVNTKLGECYEEEQGDKPDWEGIYDRAEGYEPNQPFASVAFITAGVDVQADRIEVEIVGWMKGKISQSIDYRVLVGDTRQDEVWKELDKIVNETWTRQGDKAELPLRYMAIDTGFATDKVYEFTRKHSITKVVPVKGRDKLNMIFSSPQKVEVVKAGKKLGKVQVWGVGVSMIKSEIYGYLKLRIDSETGEVPDGYCHFPRREPHYFRGLTAEEVVQVVNKRNFEEFVWVKKYKRNEPLDCRVYARAAAAIAGMDRWTNERWDREVMSAEVPVPKQQAQKTAKKKQRSSFW